MNTNRILVIPAAYAAALISFISFLIITGCNINPNSQSRDTRIGRNNFYDYSQRVELDRLLQDVSWLADDARLGRQSGSSSAKEVAYWIRQRFIELNLQPMQHIGFERFFQQFEIKNCISKNRNKCSNDSNVIAMLAGSETPEKFLIVSAHYDHLGIKNGIVFNGADDNATGVAAMLEIARIFSQSKVTPKKSIVFTAFSGEEIGRLGSKALCRHIEAHNLGKAIVALNLEMLGAVKNKGTYLNVWQPEDGSADPVINALINVSSRLSFPLNISNGSGPPSDAVALQKCGVSAATLDLAGGNELLVNHPHYHSPYDDLEYIDVRGFLHSVQVAVGVTWWLSFAASE